jgi:hypothetical protein
MTVTTNQSSHDEETTTPAAPYPIDAFWAEVLRSVHEGLADKSRRRLRNQKVFTIPETVKLTGLSAREVYALILEQEVEANEVRGWWLLPREEVARLVYTHAKERNCQAGLDYWAAIIEEETEDE